MGRRWVVDANNVMGSRPDGWWRDRPAALARLVDEITRWSDVAGEDVVVVADGFPTPRVPEGAWNGVEVRYAHTRGRDGADDAIVELLAELDDPTAHTVVSSDRRLRERASTIGADTEGARRFLDRVADIEPRRQERAILAAFGVDETSLVGRGGEARVFAIDDSRVLRLPHPGTERGDLADRRRLLDALSSDSATVALPEVLDHVEVDGRVVVIERRLPGRNALEVLGEAGTDRAGLVRHHLDVSRHIAELPCPTTTFGEIWGGGAVTAGSFRDWSVERLETSLRIGGGAFAGIDSVTLTDELIGALDSAEADQPRLVHVDAFLGNMLATGSRITALLDFGPMTIGGPAGLDPVLSAAYLAPEITPTAVDADRDEAAAWIDEAGLGDAFGPATRWAGAYWAGAPGDQQLRRWCERTLLAGR